MLDLRSKYFTWQEVLDSQTAARLGISNIPDDETQGVIVDTAQHMDRVREALGHAVLVSSWFRNLKLNRALKSKDSSQHVKGEAVDFICPGFGHQDEVFEFLRLHMEELDIDQLIREYPDHDNGGWIHISFSQRARRQALLLDSTGTKVV